MHAVREKTTKNIEKNENFTVVKKTVEDFIDKNSLCRIYEI